MINEWLIKKPYNSDPDNAEKSLLLLICIIAGILLFFNSFIFFSITFMVILFNLTDKESYSFLVNQGIIPEWYINFREKQLKNKYLKLKENIIKYDINNFIEEHEVTVKGDTKIFKRIKTRQGNLKLFYNPFDNCQTFTVANFKIIIGLTKNNYLFDEVRNFSKNIGKRQIVIDILSRLLDYFKILSKKEGFKNIQYMEYTSTNDSEMIIIKFTI